jgi:hypothetical protein
MTLRPRRGLVLWSQSAGPPGPYRARPVTRTMRLRRLLRRGALVVLVGLLALARGAWARRRTILAGTVLTVVGAVLRGGPVGLVLIPGLLLLMTAPLVPADRVRRSKLERELAAYSSPADRRDIAATLDQYPDDVTRELREILAGQAMAARSRPGPSAR